MGFHHPWASLAFSSLINMLGRVHLISPVHLAVSFRRASRVHPGFVLSSCGFASCSCVSVSSAHPSVPCSSPPPSSRRHAALLGALLRQGRRPVASRAEADFSFSLISVLGRWFAPSYRRPSFPGIVSCPGSATVIVPPVSSSHRPGSHPRHDEKSPGRQYGEASGDSRLPHERTRTGRGGVADKQATRNDGTQDARDG